MQAIKSSELATILAAALPARMPVMISGKPGIGKSEIVEAAAAAANFDVLFLHAVIMDPVDAKGMPWVTQGKDGSAAASFIPFGDLERMINAKKPLLVFLDDLGQATPAVQAALMQLVLARRVNGHVISRLVTFVAATNRRSDRAGVQGILEPLKSRFPFNVELDADPVEWDAWAEDHDIALEVRGYIRWRPQYLSKFEPTADMANSPSPRTWKFVSDTLALGLPASILHKCVCGSVGESVAAEFMGFCRIWQNMQSPDLILQKPDSADIPRQPSALAAVTFALTEKVTPKTVDALMRYLTRLNLNGHAEFVGLAIKLIESRPELVQTAAFINAMAGSLSWLRTAA